MALRKNKKLRFTTSAAEKNGFVEQQTNISLNRANVQRSANARESRCEPNCIPLNEREQRGQRDQMPSNERQQREQRDQFLSNERQPREQGDHITSNQRERRSEREQISSNLGHNNLQQQTGGSNGRVEGQIYEYTIEDSNGNRRRGKTVLADFWNLPKGHRIVVEVNKENQPVGDEGGVLGHFLGTIARNGSLCSLTYTRWDLLKKGSNKNNQNLILKEVESRFLYPKSLEYWILKSIGHKWRDYKCFLKGKGYDDDTDLNTLYDNCPEQDVAYDQWVSLVNFWRSAEGQKRSKRSKVSPEKAKVNSIHTSGTKSHARVREEMKKELEKSPTRTQVYLRCHEHEKEADITNTIKSIATEQKDKEVGLDDDPVARVLGKDQHGRVRGLGLGVKPSDVGDSSYPRFFNCLNMSSDGEVAIIHYFNQLKGQMQRLRGRVKRQSNTIRKVKRKLMDYEIFVSDDSESDTDSLTSGSNESDSEEELDHLQISDSL